MDFELLRQTFGTVASFLSTELGGFLVNQWAGIKDAKDWDEFEQLIRTSNEAGAATLRDVIGIPQSTLRVSESITDPQARAEFQARIDQGDVPEDWIEKGAIKIGLRRGPSSECSANPWRVQLSLLHESWAEKGKHWARNTSTPPQT
jgi:hypothetical protein